MTDGTVEIITAAKLSYATKEIKVLFSEEEAIRWGETINPVFSDWWYHMGIEYPVIGVPSDPPDGNVKPVFYSLAEVERAINVLSKINTSLRSAVRKGRKEQS